MNLSFGSGLVYLPEKQKYINPDKVISITQNADGTAGIYFDEQVQYDVKYPASSIAAACIKAQNTASMTYPVRE